MQFHQVIQHRQVDGRTVMRLSLIHIFLTHNIDQPFISQLEQKNEGIKFQRIDADVTDALKSKTSKKAEKEMEEQAESISKLMKNCLLYTSRCV